MSNHSDDIVTRLRNYDFMRDGDIPDVIMSEAADEIERLRAELNNIGAMADAYYELVQAYKWSHSHLGEWPDAIANLVAENYELRKAVRGE